MANDRFDICVIGAGSGGLSVTYGASHMGAKVALIERDRMGGDCLNFGCVPSKALLAAGHAAAVVRRPDAFGLTGCDPEIRFSKVRDHVQDVIATIAPNDSVERYQSFGVHVVSDHARFVAPDEVEAGGQRLKARRFVLATGSRAMVPPIPGLDSVPFMTNETVFDNTVRPDHLIVIGGGPIGCELAQAHRQLGADVTVIEMFSILPKDDQDLVEVVRQRLTEDGITLLEGAKVNSVEGQSGAISVSVERDGQIEQVTGSHLLVAAGRQPNIENMDLDKAGVDHDRRGIAVDKRLRTSNRKIFAIGDCAGGYQFTHVANYHAGIVIRNALLRLPAKVNYAALPWVTYTNPELAHVGMSEADARGEFGDSVRVLTFPYAENDRAVAERQTVGQVKAVVGRRGNILGAAIVGASAGELIHPWVLAIGSGLKIGAMAQMIAPYPTFAEINKRAAGSFYTPSVFGPRMKAIVRLLARFG